MIFIFNFNDNYVESTPKKKQRTHIVKQNPTEKKGTFNPPINNKFADNTIPNIA